MMEWEKTAAQDWSLPDYGRDENGRGPAIIATIETPLIPDLISITPPPPSTNPSPTNEGAPYEARYEQPTRSSQPSKKAPISGEPVDGFQQQAAHAAAPAFNDSPARKRWREGRKPDASIRLPEEINRAKPYFGEKTPSIALMKSLAHFRERDEVLKRIAQLTGVFMKRDSQHDQSLCIWGEPEQVRAAKTLLMRLLEWFYCQNPVDGQRSWAKIHPEYEQDIQKMLQVMAIKNEEASLRGKPTTTTSESQLTGFIVKRVYIWPKDGPTAQEELGNHLEKLDLIRKEFGVHMYLEEGSTDNICISGEKDTDMEQIIVRLQRLWKTTMAKTNTRIKAYIVEPPTKDIARNTVILVKTGKIALPFLHGTQHRLMRAKHNQKHDNTNDVQRNNSQLLLSSFQEALSHANLFAGYLRMRVHFGSFVLDRFRAADNGQKAYGLEEFREMVLLERARGRLVPGLKISGEQLLFRCMSATSVFEPVDSSYRLKELKGIIPTYSASFQFSGATNSPFRLEVDFRRRSTETEKVYHRWFKTHDEQSQNARVLPVQLGVMDFIRSDWQADIELFEPLHNDQMSDNLGSFLHSIRFDNKLRVHGMATNSRKKVLFNNDAPVSHFIEKSAIQLNVKGTKYVLELARFDRYTRRTLGWTTTPDVAWGATLFNPGWDAALGASIRSFATDPKDTARRVGDFETFFPRSAASLDGENEGFWEYLKLVHDLSGLLGLSKQEFERLSESSIKQGMAGLMDVELGMLF
ncbi:hypothetical protein N7451_004127 [Penicillium sp. IBT 35674x]|nr:hypothetical protein N7451_004127 [Penicillium sp. IBT 35674x]